MYDFKYRREACEQWVKEFTHIPQSVLVKLKERDIEDVNEVTPLPVGKEVFIGCGELCGEKGTVIRFEDNDMCFVKLDYDKEVSIDKYSLVWDENADEFPMWDTMWAFSDWTDRVWLEEHDGMQIMADLGFRLYEQEDFGIVFGIDQAGCSFYERFWIPLYMARGLKWSEEDELEDEEEDEE